MSVAIGPYRFDHATYDAKGDVLYLRAGETRAAAETLATPEGHAVRLDERGEVIGLTIVNARWLVERDGKIVISLPKTVETSAAELAPVLTAS